MAPTTTPTPTNFSFLPTHQGVTPAFFHFRPPRIYTFMEELIRIGSAGDRRIGLVLIEDSYLQAGWPVLALFNLYTMRWLSVF